jgi:hypothetical protein
MIQSPVGNLTFPAPPPLTPPHKGEGNLARGSFPSPLWGGVRGGGILVVGLRQRGAHHA